MSTALRTYYRGHSLVAMRDEAAAENRTCHFDHHGTTQCLTNQAGVVTDRFAADAWGVEVKRTGSSINRQWYIGNSGYHRCLGAPHDYVPARHLSHRRGRWLSVDPLRDPEAPHYNYVKNRPVSSIDPTGLACTSVIDERCRDCITWWDGTCPLLKTGGYTQYTTQLPEVRECRPDQFAKNQKGNCTCLLWFIHDSAELISSNGMRRGTRENPAVWAITLCCEHVCVPSKPCAGVVLDQRTEFSKVCEGGFDLPPPAPPGRTRPGTPGSEAAACIQGCIVLHEEVHSEQCHNNQRPDEPPAYELGYLCLVDACYKGDCDKVLGLRCDPLRRRPQRP